MLNFKQFLKEEIYSPLEKTAEIEDNADFIRKTNKLSAVKKQKDNLDMQIKKTEQTINNKIEKGKQQIQKASKTSPINVALIKNSVNKTIDSANDKIEKDKDKRDVLNKNIDDLQNQLTIQKDTMSGVKSI